MDLWIYNEDLTLQGIVDTAASIIWANRFRQCGDFEIYVPASVAMIELLKEDRLVGRPDSKMVGVIEYVGTETDEEAGDHLIVKGRCLRSILDRRIIWDQTALTGTVENVMRRLVTDAFISPAIPERKYDKLVLAEAHGYTDTVQVQFTGDVLLEAIEELCAANNYGFEVTMTSTTIMQEGFLTVDFYKGVDRSENQRKLPRVVFSEEYDNLITSSYTRDKTKYKSVALVAGEGEGSARRKVVVTRADDLSGLHRREIFIDARDVSSNEGEISNAEYEAQLAERGRTNMSEAAIIESFAGTMDTGHAHVLGVDYDLGDIVTVINKYGVRANAQVLEIVESWDENGYTCTPTFG